MAREWKSRPAPEPTTLHEICRRYVATAATLAKAMGLPLTEAFITAHRESIACCFIESGRAGVRLPAGVSLPPLGGEAPVAQAAEPDGDSMTDSDHRNDGDPPRPPAAREPTAAEPAGAPPNGHSRPTSIPPGLPCAGQTITALRPAQLRMLLSRVDQLAAEQGSRWRPLLEVLATERQRRVAAGQRPRPLSVAREG